MLKIRVGDVRGVLKEYEVPPSWRENMARQIQRQLLRATYQKIVKIAKTELNTTQADYLDSLSMSSNAIDLDGWMANAVEEGKSAYDLKQGFKHSPKAKPSKSGGWYLTIPFRIMTPTAPESPSTMTWEIYRAVLHNQPYNAGMRSNRPAFRDPGTGRVFDMYEHKSPILAGIRKTLVAGTSLHTYGTFRRVSNKSNPMSWIHKGFKAKHIIDRAWAEVDVEAIFEQNVNEL